MRRLLLTFVLLLFPVLAYAQHPCDSTPVDNPTVQGNQKIGACFNGKDTDGVVLTGPFVFKFYLDTDTTPTFTGTLTAVGSASATGYNYYETPTIVIPRGLHKVKATVSLGGLESLPSLPFTYTGVSAPPGSPVILKLVK